MDTTKLEQLFEKLRDVKKELEDFNRVYEQMNSGEAKEAEKGWKIEFIYYHKEIGEDIGINNANKNILLGIIKGFITAKNGELKQLNKRINNEINNIAKGEKDNG